MILDGVVDGAKWQRGQVVDSDIDADKVMDAFFANCVKAGPQRCAVHEKTAAAVSRRVERVLSELGKNPIRLPTTSSGPTVVTEAAVRNLIYRSMYSPIDGFPLIADGLRAVETANISALSQIAWFSPSTGLPPWLETNESASAVECSDFPPVNRSISADITAVRKATALSRWAGGSGFTGTRISCGAWKVRAKAPYTGPVSRKLQVPVLVISNQFDPVTPLSAANATVSRFQPGMRLLVQNTVGHTATLSLSNCVAFAINAYFNAGVLPAPGTVCQPDVIPLVDDASSPGIVIA